MVVLWQSALQGEKHTQPVQPEFGIPCGQASTQAVVVEAIDELLAPPRSRALQAGQKDKRTLATITSAT
jgi:hypothetical protein